jgi:hypothetical protein
MDETTVTGGGAGSSPVPVASYFWRDPEHCFALACGSPADHTVCKQRADPAEDIGDDCHG